ncbi:MAG: hypothetical protein PVI57_15855, partial [Gemmatimonadota bacterium]
MTWTGAALAAVAALALVAWVLWIYRRRELPVGGVGALAALRVAVVLLVLLLLFDPTLPAGSGSDGSRARVLVDGSVSMGSGTGSPWSRAVEELAGEDAERVLIFGDEGVRTLAGDPPESPRTPTTRLTPALERAAEAGARTVRVVSDLRIEDAAEASAAAARLGLAVEVSDVGEDLRDAAVGSFTVPPAVEAGEPVATEVTVVSTPEAAGDSATVEIREEGRLVASRRVALPGSGRREVVSFELPSPEGEGAVRYEASVELDGDRWDEDDRRPAWTDVDPEEGAVVMLGVRPDWEARFLLPVVGSVTGFRTRGLLRVGPGRWLLMDEAGAGGTVDDARAAREARGAALLVVQGGGSDGPPWLGDAVEGARRLLVLASAPADAALAGVDAGSPVPGEWYASPDIPPSPLAAELSGAPVEDLPPLGPILPLRDTAGVAVPLRVRRGVGGRPEAALVLRRTAAGRRAVALLPGWWRWPFRSAEGRDAYRRLWAGVAGWLLAEEAAGPGLRPSVRVVARGRPVE